ncbi:hypothetical protein Acsp04_18700 [Actinomadura sp. NBRC 104425]|nr:hypothetical protein Acsp04_18700 [Actinomadura sp. NBRC 104425]
MKVLASDPVTGRTSPRTVLTTFGDSGTKNMVRVTVDTDGERGTKTGTLQVTDNHPFWIPALKQWVDAGKLKPGMWLRTSAGTYVQITAINTWTRHQQVHNLTVESDHTYYAAAGTTPVLVHNCQNVSSRLEATADAGERQQADFASEFVSPSGQVYTAHNKEYVEIPEGLKDILRENRHPAFVCSEMKCLAKAYEKEGVAGVSGGRMTTVFVGDSEFGEHATLASPCKACRRVLSSLFVRIVENEAM